MKILIEITEKDRLIVTGLEPDGTPYRYTGDIAIKYLKGIMVGLNEYE